jgi:hypothetical protein
VAHLAPVHHPARGEVSVSAAPVGGQLDLFAESEAADKQGRFNGAPTLFDTAQQGYFARLSAFTAWQDDYDHFDSYRRSHAWHAQIGSAGVGGEQPTCQCRPAILVADL